MKPTALLAILDGFGVSPDADPTLHGNAVKLAKTPTVDMLDRTCPRVNIAASGTAVGLPPGTMGNSEVGHMNIGAGRVIYQNLLRINNAIDDGEFFRNPVLSELAKSKGRVHIFGLLGNAGVHSIDKHLYAAAELLKGAGEVYLHLFTDGRDTPPESAAGFLRETLARLPGNAKVATLIGRFYAMDRDTRWERIQIAYDALIGKGDYGTAPDALSAIAKSYEQGVTDEFVKPIVIAPEGRVQPGDSVFFINFRTDRARELTRCFVDPGFELPEAFERRFFPLAKYVTMTSYDAEMPNVEVAFPPEVPANTLGELLSHMNKTQLRIAETEKYAHVTFFLNGGVETVFPGEDRILVPSPKDFPTYDLIPQMSAYTVCEKLVDAIKSGKYDAIIVNFANCDMVGHTGVLEAAIRAVEAVDECLGKVLEAVSYVKGSAIITADHGNAEQMLAEDRVTPYTNHTVSNPVPLWLYNAPEEISIAGMSKLADIAGVFLKLVR
ncbi:MAG: 2,3-bisphosphoglycerate-independent phosphoglycerate mutase [Oscillospiraceae bacterium]|jgi:2,3-bisphosphoglycerate-independent phosphoglycerate mutase|nr:2,3-bisphosphoglycerate-independent phosphoglycerate mutase [Oscillospiraceae bacterium]